MTWAVSCGWNFWGPAEVEATDFIMNTSVTVKIFVRGKKDGEKLIREAFVEAKRIEHIMEPLKGDGELQRLNARDRAGWFAVSPELRIVVEEAKRYYDLSDGAFDPTIAPVKWSWQFEEGGRIPGDDEMAENLKLVGMSHIDLRGDSLYFPDTATKLDLGGVAKGYAVDKMIALLEQRGVKSILVNAGGDILTRGKKPDDEDWVIGLRHPRLNKTIILSHNPHSAVATSGDYERYFMAEGVRYHHILNPETGYPARECISVTVWTDNAMDADILATTIFVLGPEKGLNLAERLDDVETCIFFEKNGTVGSAISSGIKGRIGL
jgi:thiamine biosynthesis lipoprotein